MSNENVIFSIAMAGAFVIGTVTGYHMHKSKKDIKKDEGALPGLVADKVQLLEMLTASHREIKFNNNWANSTGYFDFATGGDHAPKLEKGEIVKSKSADGRLLVIKCVEPGKNVVLFQRYVARRDCVVINKPHGSKLADGDQSPDQIINILFN